MRGRAPGRAGLGCLVALLAPLAGFMAVLSYDVLVGDYAYASRALGVGVVVPVVVLGVAVAACLGCIRVERRRVDRPIGLRVFVVMATLGALVGLVLVPAWQRARCGAWKVMAASEVRTTIQAARAWREDEGSIPHSFTMLYVVESMEPHRLLDHPCGPGWDGPLMIGTVRVNDWLSGKVSDAEAMAAAEAIPLSPDGWEQIGWHWYCQDDRAWAGWSSEVAVGFALSDRHGLGVQVGFADAHVEWVRRTDAERFSQIEGALAEFGLVPPAEVRAVFEGARR